MYNGYRSKGMADDEDTDAQPMGPPSRSPGRINSTAPTPPTYLTGAEGVARMPVHPDLPNYSSGTRNQSVLSSDQANVKAFMVANAPLEQSLANPHSYGMNSNDISYDGEVMPPPPGAIAIVGIPRGLQPPDDGEEDDNLGEPSLAATDDMEFQSHHLPIVAQLAPDDADVAARVAERLERQMTEQWTNRLKQEVHQQLQQQQEEEQERRIRNSPLMAASAIAIDPTAGGQNGPEIAATMHNDRKSLHGSAADLEQPSTASSASDGSHDKSGMDNFRVCGIRRRCWGVLLVLWMIIIIGTAVGVVWYFRREKGSSPSYSVEVTDPPTSSPTTTVDSRTTNWDYLWDNLGSQIARNDVERNKFEDTNSPQSHALGWLALDDQYADNPSLIPNAVLLERYVMALLYFSAQGPSWRGAGSNFLNPQSICKWNNGFEEDDDDAQGVYCNFIETANTPTSGAGNTPLYNSVTKLNMAEMGLTGSFPWELTLLTNMKDLNMDRNFLVGTLPIELAGLTALETMWFNSNALTGTLPSLMPGKLASLDLEDNGLDGTLPGKWGTTLTDLFYTGLRLNDLYGSLPTSWKDLSNMQFLDLEANDITGTIPTDYGFLLSLESLYLEKNDLRGTLPSELGRLTNLKQLFIYDNPTLGGNIPVEFGMWTNIEFFWFYGTALTGSVDPAFCDDITLATLIRDLKGDCLGDQPEIECSCCKECCDVDGNDCTANSLT